jgi:hypothetical protein
MTVQLSADGVILLDGICPSEDAETLLQHLSANSSSPVDWRTCESAHAAVIQVLLVSRPKLLGPPAGQALREWVAPALT